MSYTENYQKWLDFAELPAYLRDELVAMDEKTKEDAFYTNLEFGTAGMRGLIGAGTNRINIYVVRQATEGLTAFLSIRHMEFHIIPFFQRSFRWWCNHCLHLLREEKTIF